MSADILAGAPTILLWEGEDVRELPKEKLIELLKELHQENERLRAENTQSRIDHISDLARVARARLHDRSIFNNRR